MDECLAHPSLKPLKQWFDAHVPPTARVVKAAA
jgi:aminoglycoside/choline kinase family phosphotransferase